MPTVADNKSVWGSGYRWPDAGDEWSRPWGGVASQWYATILPRIHRFLPAPTILEIGCGHGRWTQFLKDACRRLVLVDVSTECIDACRQRFSAATHIEYCANDGRSLATLADGSVDFAFSFDSLVHADAEVLGAYLAELGRVLTPGGAAFLHHSNLGAYHRRYARIRRVPKLEGLLITLGALDGYLHWRDPGVSADQVATLALVQGLICIRQELVHWSTRRTLIDCMSTIVRRDPASPQARRVVRNPHFLQEAVSAERRARLYEPESR
jgi:SAM-dependent methyltransferase